VLIFFYLVNKQLHLEIRCIFYKVKLFLVDPSVQTSVLGCYSVIINHLKVLLLDPAYSHMQQFIISSPFIE
jgi:hypothetical protein